MCVIIYSFIPVCRQPSPGHAVPLVSRLSSRRQLSPFVAVCRHAFQPSSAITVCNRLSSAVAVTLNSSGFQDVQPSSAITVYRRLSSAVAGTVNSFVFWDFQLSSAIAVCRPPSPGQLTPLISRISSCLQLSPFIAVCRHDSKKIQLSSVSRRQDS